MQVATVKDQLRRLDVLLRAIQKDHKNYRSDPYWKGERVANSHPDYADLVTECDKPVNEHAMRKREDDFRALSKAARTQLGEMEQLTQVSPDYLFVDRRSVLLQRNQSCPRV